MVWVIWVTGVYNHSKTNPPNKKKRIKTCNNKGSCKTCRNWVDNILLEQYVRVQEYLDDPMVGAKLLTAISLLSTHQMYLRNF